MSGTLCFNLFSHFGATPRHRRARQDGQSMRSPRGWYSFRVAARPSDQMTQRGSKSQVIEMTATTRSLEARLPMCLLLRPQESHATASHSDRARTGQHLLNKTIVETYCTHKQAACLGSAQRSTHRVQAPEIAQTLQVCRRSKFHCHV